jgi:hypothetical protein
LVKHFSALTGDGEFFFELLLLGESLRRTLLEVIPGQGGEPIWRS